MDQINLLKRCIKSTTCCFFSNIFHNLFTQNYLVLFSYFTLNGNFSWKWNAFTSLSSYASWDSLRGSLIIEQLTVMWRGCGFPLVSGRITWSRPRIPLAVRALPAVGQTFGWDPQLFGQKWLPDNSDTFLLSSDEIWQLYGCKSVKKSLPSYSPSPHQFW